MKPILTAVVAIPVLTCGMAFATVAQESKASMSKSGFVTASDGVKIHYIEAGKAQPVRRSATGGQMLESAPGQPVTRVITFHRPPTILFVPGWTMPAWIWQQQIDHFAAKYHVVAIDPRCQGESSQTSEGLYPAQMARDIKAVVDQLHLAPVVLVGWSMAVVETMSYVDQFGTSDVAGLVFVDELAGGFAPGEAEQDFSLLKGLLEDRKKTADYFVRKIQFHKPQPEEYIRRVIQASLSVPTASAVALLVGRYAADNRAVLPKIDKPTLVCTAKSFYFDRVIEMQKQIPGSKLEVFEGAGHALFVDNPEQFNSAMDSFLGSLK
jgi:non-heme chloroperoxidase